MKLQEALDIINKKRENGFMVSFEVRKGHGLTSDHFPDKHAGEPLIPTEEEAWNLAKRFAKTTESNIENIYVIDSNFRPVKGYENMRLKKSNNC